MAWSMFDFAPEWTRTPGDDPTSRTLAAEKRGRIAGLNEALEIADDEYYRDGDTRAALAVATRIRAKIKELEGK